jgi:diguanylate cyclase (GGDEF)-like protein
MSGNKNNLTDETALRDIRVFHDVGRALTSLLDLDKVLTTILNQMAKFFGPESWSLMMVDPAKQELYYVISVGDGKNEPPGFRLKMGSGIAGWVAQNGSPLIVHDAKSDPRFRNSAVDDRGVQFVSIACIPIRAGEEILGVIQLLNFKPEMLTAYAISFLYVLADYAAIAINNAKSMNQIHMLSITDDCTGLYNARHLYRMLEEEIAKTKSTKQPFCLLFCDLDRFKRVNDTHGHLVGSQLLMEVAEKVRKHFRNDDAGFRYGGDEFVMLLPHTTKEEGTKFVQGIIDDLRSSTFSGGQKLELNLTASFGLATFPEDGDAVHSIIRAADNMMYQVKQTTRDGLAVATAGASKMMPARGSKH